MQALVKAQISALLVFLGGLATISTAWGFQLIAGYVPCKLCLEQRVPYYVGLPLALFAIIAAKFGKAKATGVLLLLVAVAFFYGSGLGTYQAGAEWGFWLGPNDCGGGNGGPASAANMLQALQSTRVVSCTEASWRLMGLSFAGWNALVSLGLALLALLGSIFAFKGSKDAK